MHKALPRLVAVVGGDACLSSCFYVFLSYIFAIDLKIGLLQVPAIGSRVKPEPVPNTLVQPVDTGISANKKGSAEEPLEISDSPCK